MLGRCCALFASSLALFLALLLPDVLRAIKNNPGLVYGLSSGFCKPEQLWQRKVMFLRDWWPTTVPELPVDWTASTSRVAVALQLPDGGGSGGMSNSMPTSGLGMCCRKSAVGEDAIRSMLWYFHQGGRLIDTARVYNNQVEVGDALRIAAQHGLPRQDVWLTTKILPIGYNGTWAWLPEELRLVGTEYFDLVLIHVPGTETLASYSNCGTVETCREGTWRALSEFRSRGVVRHLGVSNFGPQLMQEIMALKLAPLEVNQLEYHPWVLEPLHEAVKFCHHWGIAVTAYCSMGGIETKDALMTQEHVKRMAEAHKKTTGQVLLRWALEKNVSVIPGTGNPKHMRENLDIYDFRLSESEVRELDDLGRAAPAMVRDEYTGIPY